MRGGFHFVVENVPRAVDRLAAERSLQLQARGVDLHVKPRVEPVPGLAAKNQLVEPGDEQVFRRLGVEHDKLGLIRVHVCRDSPR